MGGSAIQGKTWRYYSVQFCGQIAELIGFVPDQYPPKCRKIFFKSVP